jgi:hypothetical protein
MLKMLFQPKDIVNRAREGVENSFYASLNGPPRGIKLNDPMLVRDTGLIFAGSGTIMPQRKEPSPFWSKIDQFQHIENMVSQRPPNPWGNFSNLRFW